MNVRLSKTKTVHVADFAAASRAVRKFIDENDLGAGCGSSLPAFVGGDIIDAAGKLLARVSYNGRVWNLNGTEIAI